MSCSTRAKTLASTFPSQPQPPRPPASVRPSVRLSVSRRCCRSLHPPGAARAPPRSLLRAHVRLSFFSHTACHYLLLSFSDCRRQARAISAAKTPATPTARHGPYLLVRLRVRPERHRAQSCAIALRSPAPERSSDLKPYSPDIHPHCVRERPTDTWTHGHMDLDKVPWRSGQRRRPSPAGRRTCRRRQ